MAFNYNASTKSYNYTPKDNPKDRIEVEIGDALDSTTFHPQVKIKRWDNEVNASIRLNYNNIPGNISYDDDGTTIHWRRGQWEAWFYHRDDLEEGGFEFEVHIPKKPPVNYLEFTVNTKDLNWFYQPALTQQEIDEEATRPENVVGSYAVYHKTKGGLNDSAGMEYKVGKAFHVYRPHVVDNAGNKTWGTLELDEVNGILKISVDQTWLNNATYPVIVDPTFGYTSDGASQSGWSGTNANIFSGSLYTAGSGDTIVSYSARVSSGSAGTRTYALGSYSMSSGLPNTKLDQTTLSTSSLSPVWVTSSAVSHSMTASVQYTVAFSTATDTLAQVSYDSTAGTVNASKDNTASLTLPTTWSEALTRELKFSIYATYTVSGIELTANPAGAAASSNIATYSSQSIGAASADRIVVVAVGTELLNSAPTACTIDYGSGDTAMTAVSAAATFGNQNSRIFYLAVPTGTTATIKVTFGSTNPDATQNHIAVYSVTGKSFSSGGTDTSTDMDATDPVTTGSITIGTGGGFIGVVSCQNDTNAKTWSGATGDINADAGVFRFTTSVSATAGTPTVTCTGVTANEDGAFSWIIFTASGGAAAPNKTYMTTNTRFIGF